MKLGEREGRERGRLKRVKMFKRLAGLEKERVGRRRNKTDRDRQIERQRDGDRERDTETEEEKQRQREGKRVRKRECVQTVHSSSVLK